MVFLDYVKCYFPVQLDSVFNGSTLLHNLGASIVLSYEFRRTSCNINIRTIVVVSLDSMLVKFTFLGFQIVYAFSHGNARDCAIKSFVK